MLLDKPEKEETLKRISEVLEILVQESKTGLIPNEILIEAALFNIRKIIFP